MFTEPDKVPWLRAASLHVDAIFDVMSCSRVPIRE
jgi:hypothetical protein